MKCKRTSFCRGRDRQHRLEYINNVKIGYFWKRNYIIRAILVRIGIDQAFGNWNAPVAEDGSFVFVPIPEGENTKFRSGQERCYSEVVPHLDQFGVTHQHQESRNVTLPLALRDKPMHLDPDFDFLTYGDDGNRRGSSIKSLTEDDLLVFYAGLRPIYPTKHRLIYALVGLFTIEDVSIVKDVPKSRWHANAHTRKANRCPTDIVVRAKQERSGRLECCISIGEYRDRAYRVRGDVLQAWGGLSVNDGYIQRSAVPPEFTSPERFLEWFCRQSPTLVARNN